MPGATVYPIPFPQELCLLLSQTPFTTCTGPQAISDVVSSRYGAPWLAQTSFPLDTRSNGYSRLRFLQVLGPMAIPDAVSSKYWTPCLSHTPFPQELGPWLSQTPFYPCTGSQGYPRCHSFQVLGPMAILDAVSTRYQPSWVTLRSILAISYAVSFKC